MNPESAVISGTKTFGNPKNGKGLSKSKLVARNSNSIPPPAPISLKPVYGTSKMNVKYAPIKTPRKF